MLEVDVSDCMLIESRWEGYGIEKSEQETKDDRAE